MLEQIVWFRGAYDLRRPEPHKNYGIHGMEIQFAVKGPRGAVDLQIYTTWHLPHVAQGVYISRSRGSVRFATEEFCLPNITNVGYHSKKPIYEGHTPNKDCKLTDGLCYCDGSGLNGNENWREGFLHGGTDWLWPKLEQYYRHIFEGASFPDLTPIPRKHPDEETVK